MSGRGRCASCGAINRVDAPFCTQCFQRNPVTSTEANTVATPPIGLGAPIPAIAGAGAVGFPQAIGTVAPSTKLAQIKPVWRYKHLWLFGFAVWGLPEMVNAWLGTTESTSTLIDRSMLFAIFGYLLGGLVLAKLVRDQQNGDWSKAGLTAFNGQQLAIGALFGLALLGAYVPVGMMLNQGRFGLDPLVRLMVGGTSGIGLFLVGVVVVVGAPVIEEIFFRGMWYEKLRRTGTWLAIPVTAVLFTLAHGALLIPAILLMGFALGIARRKMTLWFTMGAHAAWNAAIVVIAVTVMGGTFTYGSPAEPFSISYPNTWAESDEARSVAGPRPDIALMSARGSFAVFGYEKTRQASAEDSLRAIVNSFNSAGLSKGMDQTDIMPTDVDFGPIIEGFEMGYVAPGPTSEQPFFTTLVVVQRPSSRRAIVAQFSCLRSACIDDVHDFEEMLASIRLYKW